MLKQQFKQVFQNISSVLDCVGCQKCRLHGKLQLLGIGTALKVLLLPEEILGGTQRLSSASLPMEREEIVALIQTLAKFSSAIELVKTLSSMYYQQEAASFGVRDSGSILAGDGKTTVPAPQLAPIPPPAAITLATPAPPRSMPAPAPSLPRVAVRSAPAAVGSLSTPSAGSGAAVQRIASTAPVADLQLVENSLAAIADLAEASVLDVGAEDSLVSATLQRNPDVLLLAKYFASRRPQAFARHALRTLSATPVLPATMSAGAAQPQVGLKTSAQQIPDAVVVGGGLAGLTAALTILDRGGSVVLMERMKFLGGNSAKASSGINGIDTKSSSLGDSEQLFLNDMLQGGNMTLEQYPLAGVLVKRSGKALEWVRRRSGLALGKRGQLGGHSRARTHRPSEGMSGAEMIFALEAALKPLIKQGEQASARGELPRFSLMKGATVKRLLTDSGGDVVGVGYVTKSGRGENAVETAGELNAHNVILATGGYAADRSKSSLLSRLRPDLLDLGTTNGAWADGSGHLAAFYIGAAEQEMDHVQVHPTGFIDPKRPAHGTKTLCAELLRGVGGVLLDRDGRRFVNELGTRDHVVGQMKVAANRTGGPLAFTMLLNAAAAAVADKHVPLYTKKGLLTRLPSLDAVAEWMQRQGRMAAGDAAEAADRLRVELKRYDRAVEAGTDEFGKKFSEQLQRNAPVGEDSAGPFWVGTVTPVLHYCMGGLRVDNSASVLRADGTKIGGLHAAGEVVGGIHGHNRLGGNALTECVVFGQLVGEKIRLASEQLMMAEPPAPKVASAQLYAVDGAADAAARGAAAAAVAVPAGPRQISAAELAQHNTEDSCWVQIKGKVYDFTDFLEEHPAGPEAIIEIAGKDGTEEFEQIHTLQMLDDFDPIGIAA